MITVPTFFNEPKTASQAAFITRIMDRADRLFTEGYYAYRCANGTFGVYQSGTDKAYSVNLETQSCDCEGFAKYQDCKHRIAVAQMVDDEARDAAMCEEFEKLMGSCELEPTGCDPFAKF